MANQEVTFEAGGKSYTLRFTQNAIYKLQRTLGRRLMGKPGEELADQQVMLQAGLEGYRLKNKSRAKPFSLEDAGDIIDDMRADGLMVIDLLMEAWNAAFPPPEERGAETENPPKTAAS